MTQPALDSFVRRGLALKVEGTEGQDSNPGPTTDGMLLLNGLADTAFDKRVRNVDRTVFSNQPFSVANKYAFIEGDIEIFAPATPGQVTTGKPWCDTLLQIAGMNVALAAGPKTSKYSPMSAGIPSATAHWWHNDEYLAVVGCRNDIKSLKMEIGQIFVAKVHVQGSYTTVQEQDLPAITLPYSTTPVTCAYDISEAAITVGGGAELDVWAKSLEIVFGSDLKAKEYTSVKKNSIAARAGTWNMRIAKTDLTDFNPRNVRDAGTTVVGRMRTWEGGDQTSVFSELGFRGLIETVKDVNIDGDKGWDLSGPCIASDAATAQIGDEFYLLFGDTTV